MSAWIIKHISQNCPRQVLATVEYYTEPGEDILSYTKKDMAKKCGFNYKPDNGEVITITLRD